MKNYFLNKHEETKLNCIPSLLCWVTNVVERFQTRHIPAKIKKNAIELRRFVVLKRWSTLELTLRKINGDTRKYKRIIVLKNLVFLRRVNYKLPLWEARIVEWWYKRVKYFKSLSIGFVIFLVVIMSIVVVIILENDVEKR